jgi:hypothetical protein
MSTSLITSSFAFSFHGTALGLVVFGIFNRTSTSKYALKYKVDWSSRVGLSQVFVIVMAMNYAFWKLLQSVIGGNSADLCSSLCKISALSFPLVDFAVYWFLRVRNEKSVAGDESKARKIFERILYALTFITPILAILNAVFGSGSVKKGSCITQPNASVALTVSVFEIIINFGFLLLFILPLRELARDRSALDTKRVSEISTRNFVSCLVCVIGGVFTNSAAAALTLNSSAAPVSPYLVIGSVVVVIGLLYSTWKAWEWQVVGLGKASRIVDENGDARPSEPAPVNRMTGPIGGASMDARAPSGAHSEVGDRGSHRDI